MNFERLFTLIYYSICLITIIYILTPIVIIIIISFNATSYLSFSFSGFSLHWYQAYFSNTSWIQSTILSLSIATVVALFATIVGLSTSFVLVRSKFKFKNIVSSLFILPIVIPPVVLAIGIYDIFSEWNIIGTYCGLILGHMIIALPFVILIISSSLYKFDVSLEEAAKSMGANELQTLSKITLPLILPDILTAALFAFLASFDELLISLFISTSHTITLPQRIWAGLRFEINPTIAAVSTLQIIIISIIFILIVIIKKKGR